MNKTNKEENQLGKRELLIKGFEIGLNSKDTVHTQMKLAELLGSIDEKDEHQNLCNSCEYGVVSMCKYANDNSKDAPLVKYDTKGFSNVVTSCNKYTK